MMTKKRLTSKQIHEIARLFRDRRQQLGLSTRQVGARAGISHGTVHLLEHAVNVSPRLDILRAVAEALEISQSDLFAAAEWLPTDELPTIQPYLRAKYGLSKRDAAELDDYLTKLRARRDGAGDYGPIGREDEQ